MKRFLAVATRAVCRIGRPAGCADQQARCRRRDSAVQADRELGAAFEKGNSATVNKLLDAEFTWIDTDGIMWERPDALRAGLKPLVPNASDVKTLEHKYAKGKVVWVQNNQGNKYAAHIWVQRPAGWRLLHANEIATRPADPIANVRPDYAVPCINPCKEVPYKPISASEKAVLAAWQDQEGANGPGHHDMHIGDNVVVISSTTTTPRPSATAPGPTPVNPAAAESPAGRGGPGIVGAHLGLRRRGGRDHDPADLWRQSVLVQPHIRQSRWFLENGRELSHDNPGVSADDRVAGVGGA